MEMEYLNDKIIFDKVLNDFDKFTFSFVKILDKLNINYVLISGYVALLFGRTRMTEDIDIFIEKLSFERFGELWNELLNTFECINTQNAKEAYEEYLLNNSSINFSLKGRFLPRMEVKFPKKSTDSWSIANKKKVVLNGRVIYISPLELQITFKLTLGSEKDIEDARYLYRIFKDFLDKEMLNYWIKNFKIEKEVKYLS
ncbi:MAG: hypothetical protein WC376_03170 [Candidatus Nanoarchaeia archaeon]